MFLFLGASLVLAVVAVSSLHSGESRGSIMGAVLALVGAVVCVSLALFKAGLDYVAVVYLLVYIGAVLILLMFVVLSVDTVGSASGSGFWALNLGLLFVVVVVYTHHTQGSSLVLLFTQEVNSEKIEGVAGVTKVIPVTTQSGLG